MTTYTYLSGPSRLFWGEVRPSNPLVASSSRVLSRRRPTTKSANGRMMRLPLPPLPPPHRRSKLPSLPPLQSNNPEMVSEGWTTQCNLGRREEEGLSASALSRIYQCQDGREGIAYHFQGDHLGGGGDGKTIGTWDILRCEECEGRRRLLLSKRHHWRARTSEGRGNLSNHWAV